MHISKFRVPVPKVLNLPLTGSVETMITLTVIALLVLPLTVQDAKSGENKNTDLAAQVDSVASVVFGCVLDSVGPGRDDATCRTEGDDVCGGD